MKLVKFLLGTVMSLAVLSAHSQINIVNSLPAGGMSDKIHLAAQDALENAGYKTNLVRFDNCKGLETWIKNNPTKPAIFDYLLPNQLLYLTDPGHPAGCNIPLSRDSIVSIGYQSQTQICSLLPAAEAMELFRSGKGKVGVVAAPEIFESFIGKIVNELAPNTKVVRYKGNAALIQAMSSRDVEFVTQVGNASSAAAAGAQCFLTMGDRAKAAKLKSTSVDDIKSNSSVRNLGQMTVLVGYNIDMDKIRPIIVNLIKTMPDMKKQVEAGAELGGVAVGQTADQQWQEVSNYLNKYKK